jgi:cytochrome P450
MADYASRYNYTTFDIIGDLSFGQSFDCLNSSTYHSWVLNVFHLLENFPLTFGKLVYPVSFKLLGLLVTPKKVRGSRDYQTQLVEERLESRMNNESQKGRCDFVDSMMRHQGDKDEISFDEMVENASILVLAGSETTATLLSGVTYYLCKTPRVYKKVKEEVRSKFKAEEDITFASVVECKYMLAVLEEGLRIYPPAPSVFPRQALEDMVVDGVKVPKGTHVGVHQLATHRAQENWSRPNQFVPERWTKEGKEGEFKDDRESMTGF